MGVGTTRCIGQTQGVARCRTFQTTRGHDIFGTTNHDRSTERVTSASVIASIKHERDKFDVAVDVEHTNRTYCVSLSTSAMSSLHCSIFSCTGHVAWAQHAPAINQTVHLMVDPTGKESHTRHKRRRCARGAACRGVLASRRLLQTDAGGFDRFSHGWLLNDSGVFSEKFQMRNSDKTNAI